MKPSLKKYLTVALTVAIILGLGVIRYTKRKEDRDAIKAEVALEEAIKTKELGEQRTLSRKTPSTFEKKVVSPQSLKIAESLRSSALQLLESKNKPENDFELLSQTYAQLKEAAAKGSIEALKDMAYMTQHGLGVEKNAEAALNLWLDAAIQGDSQAMMEVGNALSRGGDIEPNYLFAADWYAEAAEAGEAEASARLGQLYAAGRGVPQDYELALDFYREAAEAGSSKGDLYLGLAYLEGWGVEPNSEMALSNLRKSANAGDAQAQYALYEILNNKEFEFSDQAEARLWLQRSIAMGEVDAVEKMSEIELALGRLGRTEELLDTIDLLGAAATLERPKAAYELAKLTLKNDKTPEGFSNAWSFAEAAANMGEKDANFMMARLNEGLLSKPGLASYAPVSRGDPLKWLKSGSSVGDARSQYALSLVENNGIGVSDAIRQASSATQEDMYLVKAEDEGKQIGEPRSFSNPVKLKQIVKPVFPQGLELQDFSGEVMVELVVNKKGRVIQSRPVNEEHPELVKSALESVGKWVFEPATDASGAPTLSKVRVPIRFNN